MALLRIVVPATTLFFAARTEAQGTQWLIPDHGVVRYEEQGEVRGVLPGGAKRRLCDGASTVCQPLLFADELVDEGRRWLREPWSLESIPIWLAADLATFDKPGAVRHVWPRIDSYGEVTFSGSADKPDAEGWQRITGRLTRVPVRERAGASAREIEVDRWYMPCALDVSLEVRRRFVADAGVKDRYRRRGVVQAIEWEIEGRLEGDHPRQPMQVSGKRSWQLRDVRQDRQPATAADAGFAGLVQETIAAATAHQLEYLRAFQGTVAEGESRGAVHGPSLHAACLYGLARAGLRAGHPDVDASLARLLPRQHTQAHGRALTILAIAGLHAPADDRVRCRHGQPPPITLPAPMRAAMAEQVRLLLQMRRSGKDGQTFWSFAQDVDDRSLFHSAMAIQALDAAVRCGTAVPAGVFEAFARNLVATALDVPGAKAATIGLEADTTRPAAWARATAGAACWTDSDLGAFGSHGADVAWAMAALLACQRHVRDGRLREQSLECVAGGWAWLGEEFTARHCPAPMTVHRQYRYSFAQAMAWLLDESGVRWLNGRDVYHELASILIVETRKGQVLTTVVDPPAALSLWRPHEVGTGTITPGR